MQSVIDSSGFIPWRRMISRGGVQRGGFPPFLRRKKIKEYKRKKQNIKGDVVQGLIIDQAGTGTFGSYGVVTT